MIPKNDSFEQKWKKCLDILSSYTYMYATNELHMIYGSWNVRCGWQKILSFCVIFCPFSPLTTRKIKILKLKKAPEHITITYYHFTHLHHNDNDMMYGFWDMKRDGQNVFSFWTIFWMKIKKKKKWKKRLEISSFDNSAPKIMIICYAVPEIWCVTNVIIFHFWLFFALLSH